MNRQTDPEGRAATDAGRASGGRTRERAPSRFNDPDAAGRGRFGGYYVPPNTRPAPEEKPASRFGTADGARADRADDQGGGRRGFRTHRRAARRNRAAAKWLDRLRQDEAGAIVLRVAAVTLVLIALLGMFALLRPGINLARARVYVRAGRVEEAAKLIEAMAAENYPANRIDAIRYDLGDAYLEQGDWAAALALQAELPEGERTQALALHARYTQADQRYGEKDFEQAAELFYQLGDYSDSADRYLDSRCAVALSAFQAGREGEAQQLLLDTDHADAHIENAALAVTGDEAAARRLIALDIFSPESLARQERDKDVARSALANAFVGRIAAGYRHTAGLRADGTVAAAGDNASGQLEVSGWTDIAQLAAGAEHTVGLRRDGTVVAAGNNRYGQCDVGEWRDITTIAANAYGTFGLKSDGTVVASRSYADAVSGWHGVTQIAAGGYSAACLYGRGSVLTTHAGARIDTIAAVSALSISGTVSAGILSNGALVCSYDGAPDWRGLQSVTVSPTGMIGLFSDGAVRFFDFRTNADTPLVASAHIVEIASSGMHHVALADDGRVYAFGDNAYGQCSVDAWQLQTADAAG